MPDFGCDPEYYLLLLLHLPLLLIGVIRYI